MLIYIDNIEELMQNMRDSERAQLAGRVETLLEDWVASLSRHPCANTAPTASLW